VEQVLKRASLNKSERIYNTEKEDVKEDLGDKEFSGVEEEKNKFVKIWENIEPIHERIEWDKVKDSGSPLYDEMRSKLVRRQKRSFKRENE